MALETDINPSLVPKSPLKKYARLFKRRLEKLNRGKQLFPREIERSDEDLKNFIIKTVYESIMDGEIGRAHV
jgi:hypothetical protein